MIRNFVPSILSLLFTAAVLTARPLLKPVTVCDVLEQVSIYEGREVLVIGRLSTNFFDGIWLSQGVCNKNVPVRDPNFPYAIVINQSSTKPRLPPNLSTLDHSALQAKMKELRRTTSLGFDENLWVSKDGRRTGTVAEKEKWGIMLGRVESEGGPYGAVHAMVRLIGSAKDLRVIDDSKFNLNSYQGDSFDSMHAAGAKNLPSGAPRLRLDTHD